MVKSMLILWGVYKRIPPQDCGGIFLTLKTTNMKSVE